MAELARNWEEDPSPEKISEGLAKASGRLGKALELDEKTISRVMGGRDSIGGRRACGGPSPAVTAKTVKSSRRSMEKMLDWASEQRNQINSARLRVRALQKDMAD